MKSRSNQRNHPIRHILNWRGVRAIGVLVAMICFMFFSCEQTSLLFEIKQRVGVAGAGGLGAADGAELEVVATPEILPIGGTYTSDQTVTITDVTEGATIYYTIDGSNATTSSAIYTGPISFAVKGRNLTVTAFATASGMSASIAATEDYNVLFAVGGAGPAGGTVIYDKGDAIDGWRYLEAAPSDQSAGISWDNGNVSTSASGTAVGTGQANTTAIVAAQGAGTYAAKWCDDLIQYGHDDWFLPSTDELDLMFQMRDTIGGFFTSWGNYYWSSTEQATITAWFQHFYNSDRSYDYKYKSYRVRAARAF